MASRAFEPQRSAALSPLAPHATPVHRTRTPQAGAAPLRILHVVRQYAPGVGGIETYVAMLAKAQQALGHDVRVLTLDRLFLGDGARLPQEETIDGIAVRRVGYAGSPRFPVAPAMLRRLKDVDIVHVHGVDSVADMLGWTRALHGRPLIVSTHGGFFHTGFAKRLKRLYFHTVTRASLLGARAILSSSTQDQATFAPLWPGKTALVENGVDVAAFRGLAKPGTRRMIYFGRLAPNKELGRLLGWFAALAQRAPGWELTIAGRPMGVDPASLRDEAERLGIGAVVEIHASPSGEALRALIARSSVYACASSYEGFGIAAVEAASAGLYPLLADIPAFVRTRERLGFGTIADFSGTADVDRFLDELSAFETIPPAPDALDAALAPYGWEHAVARIDGIYDRVLGRGTRRIGTIDISVLERETAIATVIAAVVKRRPAMIGFCNAHTVNVARRNTDFTAALRHEIILNDGVGVDIASRVLYGQRFPSNLNGTDLIPETLASLPAGTRVFLVGSKPGIAEAAGRRLAARYPDIVIAGAEHGFFTAEEEPALAERIKAAEPDLVLAGMGQPRQELWAARNVRALGVPVVCCGAYLDFESGSVPRAPQIFQKTGLEWAFRLTMEPQRLAGRYLVGNITFLTRLVGQWLAGRRGAD